MGGIRVSSVGGGLVHQGLCVYIFNSVHRKNFANGRVDLKRMRAAYVIGVTYIYGQICLQYYLQLSWDLNKNKNKKQSGAARTFEAH